MSSALRAGASGARLFHAAERLLAAAGHAAVSGLLALDSRVRFACALCLLISLPAALCLYSWNARLVHQEARQEQLRRQHGELTARVAQLREPGRIRGTAVVRLGLYPPAPEQVRRMR